MFCPECRTEYRPGFFRCSDCDAPLVNSLPEEDEYGPELDYGPVVVFVSSNLLEANLIKSLLEANGIPVAALDENLWNYSNPAVGIKLVVAAEHESFARLVLQEYRGKEGQSPASGASSPVSF